MHEKTVLDRETWVLIGVFVGIGFCTVLYICCIFLSVIATIASAFATIWASS